MSPHDGLEAYRTGLMPCEIYTFVPPLVDYKIHRVVTFEGN
jgi:hypothetical protein